MHKGDITAYSEGINYGSTFIVTIPLSHHINIVTEDPVICKNLFFT